MTSLERIDAFVRLGEQLQKYLNGEGNLRLDNAIKKAYLQNNWFTESFVRKALQGIVGLLQIDILETWIASYKQIQESKKVACIMAGNVPMVGFHDLLTVLLSGHIFIGKLSSKDTILLPVLVQLLNEITPDFQKRVYFVEQLKRGDYDAVIATGSNNSARYFKQYFGEMPNIIRTGRSSIAILSGKEDKQALERLTDDLFLYFGLGCRNVSKIYIPKGFDIRILLDSCERYRELQNHHKWMNNYDYNRSIMLVNQDKFLDTGFALFTEQEEMLSPISVVHYQEYETEKEVLTIPQYYKNMLQCVVSDMPIEGFVPFGQAQFPRVYEYADGIDTMAFLTNL